MLTNIKEYFKEEYGSDEVVLEERLKKVKKNKEPDILDI